MEIKTLFKHWIELDFRYLEEYASTIENLLATEVEELSARVKKKAAKLTEEEEKELYDFYSDDFWLLSQVFPNKLRLSLFVICYAFLESRLQTLCLNLKVKFGHKIGIEEIKGKGIFRSRIYLEKVIGVNFPEKSSQWQDIMIYNRIRNSIVHSDGRLDAEKENQVKIFIDQKKWIELDTSKRIQLLGTFYQEVIETLEKFFDELLDAIP
jgi:hypothetical protein